MKQYIYLRTHKYINISTQHIIYRHIVYTNILHHKYIRETL